MPPPETLPTSSSSVHWADPLLYVGTVVWDRDARMKNSLPVEFWVNAVAGLAGSVPTVPPPTSEVCETGLPVVTQPAQAVIETTIGAVLVDAPVDPQVKVEPSVPSTRRYQQTAPKAFGVLAAVLVMTCVQPVGTVLKNGLPESVVHPKASRMSPTATPVGFATATFVPEAEVVWVAEPTWVIAMPTQPSPTRP